VASSLENIGLVYADQGKHVEALEMYGKALATYDRALGVDNMDSARVYHNIAISKKRSGDDAGALESARESVRIYTKLGIDNSDSQDTADVLKQLEGGA
jgi:tetratricopeptide (TPR) repeat protein